MVQVGLALATDGGIEDHAHHSGILCMKWLVTCHSVTNSLDSNPPLTLTLTAFGVMRLGLPSQASGQNLPGSIPTAQVSKNLYLTITLTLTKPRVNPLVSF